MNILNGGTALDARVGPILRALARRLSPPVESRGSGDWHERLLGAMRRYAPVPDENPRPTAILLHGCAGDFAHLEGWGRFLAENGILAYAIDSLTPRGLGPLAARLLVCTGLRLQGFERCRDITEVLPQVLADPMVDRDRISLVGWSHGAWTVTEWMLDDEARDFADRNGLGIRSVVLAYPYCGLASNIHEKEWQATCPVMVVTGDKDVIVPNAQTRAFIDRLERGNVPVTHVQIEGAGHAFDVEGNIAFDAGKTQALRALVLGFLGEVNGETSPRADEDRERPRGGG